MINNNVIKLSRCSIDDSELHALKQVFSDAYLGMGKQVFEFENEIKAYLNTQQDVVCVNSGTAALHLAVSCLDIGPGDEVLLPTLTFAACYQAISATGATPVACDIREDTLSIDLQSAEKYLTHRTRAIMPVHYASHVTEIDAIHNFAKINQLRVIEDAAHAFGTDLPNGNRVGSQGDIICFSFDGIKNITCGEGGAVLTNDSILLERLRDARLLGIEKDSLKRKEGKRSWEFDIKHQGYRYHMSDINAAIGRAQLRKISGFKERRRNIVREYTKNLKNISIITLLELDYENIMPHIFVIRVLNQKRDGLKNYLQEYNIETGIHYRPNHLLTRYKTKYSLEKAEKIYQEILTLPLHVGITEQEQENIISLIKEYCHHA